MRLSVLSEEKMVTVYHISPHANIQQFNGRYSGKHNANGIFVCESWNSLVNDWLHTISAKRFGNSTKRISTIDKRRYRLYDKHEGCSLDDSSCPDKDEHKRIAKMWSDRDDNYTWKNLTIYKLKIPQRIMEISKQMNYEAYEMSDKNSGAWGWGVETFIHEEYLDQIQIIGRKTLNMHDRIKLYEKNRNKNSETTSNIYAKIAKYRKTLEELIQKFGRAPLLVRAEKFINSLQNGVRIQHAANIYKTIDDLIEPYLKQM